MSQQPPLGVKLVGANRRLILLLSLYGIGLFALMAFVSGSITVMLIAIVFLEVVLSFWRPTPKLGPSSYSTPEPPVWRELGEVGRWYQLIQSCGGLIFSFLVISVIFGAVIFSTISSPRWQIGAANWITLGVFSVWLVSRRFWSPALMKLLRKSWSGSVTPTFEQWSPTITPTGDGFDIAVPIRYLNRNPQQQRPWGFHIAYPELDEVRTLGQLDANAYWQSVEQYDTALDTRQAWELFRFAQGQIARPSIFQQLSVGTHLLMRGPTLLYLFGAMDAQAPAVLAAWQAWRAVHPQPSGVPA